MPLEIFLLSGSPGTGKTSIAKYIEKKFHIERISLGEEVKQFHLYSEIDTERDTKIVDEQKFNEHFRNRLNQLDQRVLIEGHYADMIYHSKIKLGIILRCHPNILEKRLQKRDYSNKKVLENVQAELLGDSTSYMLEKETLRKKKMLFEIDTSSKTIENVGVQIYEILQHPDQYTHLVAGRISWLSDPTVDITRFQKFS